MLTLVVGYLALFSYALYTEPSHKASQQPLTDGMLSEASPKPPESLRSKQAITELLEETAAFQEPVEKSGIQLINEWRETITSQNPERICLDLDSRSLQEKISALASRLDSSQREISSAYEKNRIDGDEFNKIFGSPMGGIGPNGFGSAAQALRNYNHEINLAGERPSCEAVLKSGLLLNFVNMVRGLDQFGVWIAQVQENLSRYRDDLRKELRSIR